MLKSSVILLKYVIKFLKKVEVKCQPMLFLTSACKFQVNFYE